MDPSGTQTIDDISPLPSSVDKNANSSSDDYDVKYDKAMANEALVNEIKKHVLPNLGKEGKKEVESIIEMIQNGSLDYEIYKEGIEKKPELGSKAKPTNLRHLVGKDLYYIARARDYQIRNNTNEIPQYYVEYGAKYMFAFKYDTRNELSEQGQKWLDDTLVNLQDEMENVVSENPQCETIPRGMPESLKKLAFDSHVDAYLNAGICNVADDWSDIVFTPDLSDLWDGKWQSLSVAIACMSDMPKMGILNYNTGMPGYNANRMLYNMKMK